MYISIRPIWVATLQMKLRSQFPSIWYSSERKKVNEATVSNYINLIHILTVIVFARGELISKRKEFHQNRKHKQEHKPLSVPEGEYTLFSAEAYHDIECESDPLLRIPRSFNGTLFSCGRFLSFSYLRLFSRLTSPIRRNSNFSHVIKLLVFLSNSPVWWFLFSVCSFTAAVWIECFYVCGCSRHFQLFWSVRK